MRGTGSSGSSSFVEAVVQLKVAAQNQRQQRHTRIMIICTRAARVLLLRLGDLLGNALQNRNILLSGLDQRIVVLLLPFQGVLNDV